MKLLVVLTSLLCCAAAFPQLADEDLLEGSGVPPPLSDGLQEPLEIVGEPLEIVGEPLEIVGEPLEILAEPELPKEAAPELPKEAAPELPKEAAPELPKEAAPELPKEAAPELPKEAAPELPKEAAPEAVVEKAAPAEEVAQPAPSLLKVAPRKSVPISLFQRTSPVSVQPFPVPKPSTLSTEDILSQSFDMNDQGGFVYQFETSDGTAVDAAGQQKQIGDGVGTIMSGKYSYVAPNGQIISITWVADEGGFQPSGDAIPKVPA